MPENDEAVTFNIREIQYIECCDCGLVHEVEYDIYDDGKILMTMKRKNERTKKARIKRAGNKGKLMCSLLDESLSREKLIPGTENRGQKTEDRTSDFRLLSSDFEKD